MMTSQLLKAWVQAQAVVEAEAAGFVEVVVAAAAAVETSSKTRHLPTRQRTLPLVPRTQVDPARTTVEADAALIVVDFIRTRVAVVRSSPFVSVGSPMMLLSMGVVPVLLKSGRRRKTSVEAATAPAPEASIRKERIFRTRR